MYYTATKKGWFNAGRTRTVNLNANNIVQFIKSAQNPANQNNVSRRMMGPAYFMWAYLLRYKNVNYSKRG